MKKQWISILIAGMLITGCASEQKSSVSITEKEKTEVENQEKVPKEESDGSETEQKNYYAPDLKDCLRQTEEMKNTAVSGLRENLEQTFLSVSGKIEELEQGQTQVKNLVSMFEKNQWNISFEEMTGTVFHEVRAEEWKALDINVENPEYECKVQIAFWNENGEGFRMEEPVSLTKQEHIQLDYSNANESYMGIWFTAEEGADSSCILKPLGAEDSEQAVAQIKELEQLNQEHPFLSGDMFPENVSQNEIYAEGKHFVLTVSEMEWYQKYAELMGYDYPEKWAFYTLCEKKTVQYLAEKENITISEDELDEYGFIQVQTRQSNIPEAEILTELYGSVDEWWMAQREWKRLELIADRYQGELNRQYIEEKKLEDEYSYGPGWQVYYAEKINEAIASEQIKKSTVSKE